MARFATVDTYLNARYDTPQWDAVKRWGTRLDDVVSQYYVPVGMDITPLEQYCWRQPGGSAGAIALTPVYLNCPYKDKDEAKALGAKWDSERKKWVVPPGLELDKFAKWLPTAPSSSPAHGLAGAAGGSVVTPPRSVTAAAPAAMSADALEEWMVDFVHGHPSDDCLLAGHCWEWLQTGVCQFKDEYGECRYKHSFPKVWSNEQKAFARDLQLERREAAADALCASDGETDERGHQAGRGHGHGVGQSSAGASGAAGGAGGRRDGEESRPSKDAKKPED